MKDLAGGIGGNAIKTDLAAVQARTREKVESSLHHAALFLPVHQILQIGPAPGCDALHLRCNNKRTGPAKNIDLAPGAPEVPGQNRVTLRKQIVARELFGRPSAEIGAVTAAQLAAVSA